MSHQNTITSYHNLIIMITMPDDIISSFFIIILSYLIIMITMPDDEILAGTNLELGIALVLKQTIQC